MKQEAFTVISQNGSLTSQTCLPVSSRDQPLGGAGYVCRQRWWPMTSYGWKRHTEIRWWHYLIVPAENSTSCQAELSNIKQWATDNNLRLNPDRTLGLYSTLVVVAALKSNLLRPYRIFNVSTASRLCDRFFALVRREKASHPHSIDSISIRKSAPSWVVPWSPQQIQDGGRRP